MGGDYRLRERSEYSPTRLPSASSGTLKAGERPSSLPLSVNQVVLEAGQVLERQDLTTAEKAATVVY